MRKRLMIAAGVGVTLALVALVRIAAVGDAPVPNVEPTVAPTYVALPVPSPTPQRVRVLCTGSMEPAITCLDLMVTQPVFGPNDIEVGTIISAKACGKRFAHRVIAARERDGITYYQTQGDAHELPDNCWFTLDDVKSVIESIERDRVPANTRMRDGFNAAKAAILANPTDRDAIATFHCWRRAALTAKYPGDMPHEC